MSQIIVSDLEISQVLDRQALNGVLGGKRRKGSGGGYGGEYQSYRFKFIYKEEFKGRYKFKHYNPCYDYHYSPCHDDRFHCHW